MENGGNRSHDPGEDLRSHGEAKAESFELIDPVSEDEAQKVTRSRMNRHLKIRFLEIDGGHPVPLTYRQENRLNGLHLKVRHVHKAIEMGEVDDWTPRPRGLPHYEQTAVKAWRRERSKLHSTLGNEGQGDLLQSSTLDGSGAVRRHWERGIGKWRGAEEGQTIAEPQHLYHPRLRTPVPPGLPVEGQTTAGKGPER